MTRANGNDDRTLPSYTWPAEPMAVKQVAETVLLTPKTVRQRIRKGALRAVQFGQGSSYRVHRADAQRWVEALVVDHERRQGVDRVISRRRSRLAGAPASARPPRGDGL